MKQIFHEVIIETNGPGLYDFTEQTQDFVNNNKLLNGILNLKILHTIYSHILNKKSYVYCKFCS